MKVWVSFPMVHSALHQRTARAAPSIQADLRQLHDLGPALDFLINEGAKLAWRHRPGFGAIAVERIPHDLVAHRLADFDVDLLDDGVGRALERDQSIPLGRLETGNGFRDRGTRPANSLIRH